MNTVYFVLTLLILITVIFSSCTVLHSASQPFIPNASSLAVEDDLPIPILVYPKNYHVFNPDDNVYIEWTVSSTKTYLYDLYFGKDKLHILKSNTKDTMVNVAIEPHTSYEWQIVVKGKEGKIRKGPIWHFSVKCRGWR